MNKYAPHVYVIPEDDADRQIANGFALHENVDTRRMQVMPEAGGWSSVIDTFQNEYIQTLRNYPLAHVVMLIDFDGQVEKRRDKFEQAIPDELKERAFVVGSKYDLRIAKPACGWERGYLLCQFRWFVSVGPAHFALHRLSGLAQDQGV